MTHAALRDLRKMISLLLHPWLMRVRYILWMISGSPPLDRFGFSKKRLLIKLGKDNGFINFLETGTFRGDALVLLRNSFKRLYSIEVDPGLADFARRRVAGQPHIEVICGDSASKLGELLSRLQEPSVVWLDGHYSGPGTSMGNQPCPLREELAQLARHGGDKHCIAIDDTRALGVDPAYPSMDEVITLLRRINPEFEITEHENDILVALPGRHGGAVRGSRNCIDVSAV